MRFPPDHPLVERVRAHVHGATPRPPRSSRTAAARSAPASGSSPSSAPRTTIIGAVVFIPDALEREALLERDDVFVPPYEGAYGWLAIRVEAASGDWDLVEELLDASYRRVALVRQLRALDADPVVPVAD